MLFYTRKEEGILRKFIFKDTVKNKELVLPVTPASFEISHGIRVETINIHTLGDVNIAGYGTLASIKVDCLFPAQSYSFALSSAGTDPYKYVKAFQKWSDNRTVLRFVVSETPVNIPVLVETVTYSEKDGTGDVYATVSLRQYREMTAVQTSDTGSSTRSTTETATVTPETYKIEPGDTLWVICRKKYGDATLHAKLAAYNSIQNPNLIRVGYILTIPDVSQL